MRIPQNVLLLMSLQLSTETGSQQFAKLIEYMPAQAVQILRREFARSMPVFSNDFSEILKHCLIAADTDRLSQIYGVTNEFAQAIKKHVNQFVDYDSFCGLLLPYATRPKIERRLCRILINQTDALMEKFLKDKITYYAHVLAKSDRCGPLVNEIRCRSGIPIIIQNKEAAELAGNAKLQYDNDNKAEQIYESAVASKFK
jgi:predicted nucleotidyltransferase